jgi:8-hydroxy-5-deazaflavin:NADPH oxidoreductase
MKTKNAIAVIGTGRLGKLIAIALTRGNHRLLVFDREIENADRVIDTILSLNPEAEAEAIHCSAEASWEADIIISAVSAEEQMQVAGYVKQYATQKIFVSVSECVKNTSVKSSGEELQASLPFSQIIRAYYQGEGSDSFLIAGNNKEAVDYIFALLTEAGFKAEYKGTIKACREIEGVEEKINNR